MQAEVLIVGKGMAGLTLSYLLSQKNITHHLLFRKDERREMALGETLPPSAIPLLKNMGLLHLFESTAIQKTYGYHSLWGSHQVSDHNFYFQHSQAYGLKIDKQAILTELEKKQSNHLQSYSINQQIAFDKYCVIVDATGRNRAVLKQMGISSDKWDDLIAYSCHLPGMKHPRLTHKVFTETFKDGWGIVSALDAQTNIMTLYTDRSVTNQPMFSRYECWSNILSGTVYLKDFLTTDQRVKVKGKQSNSSRARMIAGDNWLAVGDAAIAFDPLSSHGITNALYTANLAAAAIQQKLLLNNEEALVDYGKTLSAIFDSYLQTKDKLYQQERRWPESSFWRSRHSELAF